MMNNRSVKIRSNEIFYCNCCGSTSLDELGMRLETLSSTKNLFTFRFKDTVCLSCGFVFSKERQNEDDISLYYTNYHPEASQASAQEHNIRYSVIEKYLHLSKNVCEIGGGVNSSFTKYLKGLGIKINNIEISDAWPDVNSADLIISYYLLEHINQLDVFLSKINGLLKKNGIFIFEVPDYLGSSAASLNEEHVNHFNEKCFFALAARYGFKNVTHKEELVSRSYGITAVFKKISEVDISLLKNTSESGKEIYDITPSKLIKIKENYRICLRNRAEILGQVREICEASKSSSQAILVWGCNQNFIRIKDLLVELEVKFTIVDSSRLKQSIDYFDVAILDPSSIDLNDYNSFLVCVDSAFQESADSIILRSTAGISKIKKVHFAE